MSVNASSEVQGDNDKDASDVVLCDIMDDEPRVDGRLNFTVQGYVLVYDSTMSLCLSLRSLRLGKTMTSM